MAVCLYGYVLPTESVSLFFRSRFCFIEEPLLPIRGILYASFFGFIFLKGIAEVSSGVSIGGRPYFRNVPCFLSDRLFFCILSKPIADFQVLSFSYHFLVKSNHFPLQI